MKSVIKSKLKTLAKRIEKFKPDPIYKYDKPALVTVKEALKAAKKGNYGVGACIYNKKTGEIVVSGCDKVYHPYFKSSMHAEMVTLDKFEDKMKFQFPPKVNNLILFASLEPCPMCMTRIINSGILKVKYLEPDHQGGMIHLFKNLPPIWQKIAKNRVYKQPACSLELIDIVNQLHIIAADKFDAKLVNKN